MFVSPLDFEMNEDAHDTARDFDSESGYNLDMNTAWRKTAVVSDDGRIEVIVPELRKGDSVDVVVRRNGGLGNAGPRTGYGSAAGRVHMRDDFDAPLEDFSDYM